MRGTFSVLKVREDSNHWNKEESLMGEAWGPCRTRTDPNRCPDVACENHEGEMSELIGNSVQLSNSEDNYYCN